MAMMVIRLHPVEPINGADFKSYLDGLVIEAFDLSVHDGQLGVSVGTTAYVQPVPPPPPDPPTPWIPAPTTGIVQHFDLPGFNAEPIALAVATAVIEVNPPAGHPEHRECDVRLKVTRGGKEILSSRLYYNVPVEPGGIPANRATIATLATTSLYLALPDPGREIDPADGYLTVAPDGTPPRYDQLRAAVDVVIGHDPGVGNAPHLADLTPRQARHVAYEIVWNSRYRPLPAPPKRTLAQMYTLPEQDTDGGDAAARGQFQGNLQAYYATGDADAERLAGFVLALAAGVYAAQRSAAADRVGFLMPVMPNESDSESRFKSVRVILSGAESPTSPPAALATPFSVPAAYFYALGATIPPQIDRDERYRLAVLAEEEHTRRALESAIAAGVLLADAAGNVVIDGVNVSQAARRLRSLGAVQGVAPVFALNGPEPDRTAVRALVAAWLAYAGDNIMTFWRASLPPPPAPATSQIAGHLELVLRAVTDSHQALITVIRGLPANRVQDIHQLTVAQWRALFGEPIDESLLPRFTQPGSPADRVAAFIRHVQKFFAVELNASGVDTPTEAGPPRLRTSAADPIGRFTQRYRQANGTEFVFGGVWDANLVSQAAASVFPPDREPDAYAWLIEAVGVIDELVRLSTSTAIPAELVMSLMEALYARGFTDRDQVGRMTAAELRTALVGTVAFEYADAIHANGTGAPPVVEQPAAGFTPINPDGCLVNCVPPEHLSPLGPVAYLHELLKLTQNWTCAGPPPSGDEQPTLGELIAARRGPVSDLRVTAANLSTQLPLADLVDECLEAVAADPRHPIGAVYDTGEVAVAGHRLADHDAAVLFAAVPEHSTPATPVARPAGYHALATDFSVPSLPYAQSLDVNRSYLRQLGSSRYDVMRRFRRDITEFAVAPEAEPAEFQRTLWRYPVRIDIAREYLGISAEEHRLLFGTDIESAPVEGRLTLPELYGFPAARRERAAWKGVVVRLPEFLRRTGLSYCEFLALWRSQYVPFRRADDDGGFPDCEPCHLDELRIEFGVRNIEAPLRRLAVFIRLWRRLRSVPDGAYSFAELRDICVTLRLFNDDATINPDFIRQLAAFQMLRDSFGIALVDRYDPPPAHAVDENRTHLLSLWVGPGAAKWPWALDELLDQVQVYALATHKCRRRSAEFRKLLADNLSALSALAGFDADGWRAKPTHTLRFAELLAKIYASDFTVGELLFVGTAADHLGGDDPFPLQPDNESTGSPLSLPDDESEHSLAALRRTLLAVEVTDEQADRWTWRRIAREMRVRFGYAPAAGDDPLLDVAEHFFPSAIRPHGRNLPEERRQYRVDLPGTAEAMWNTPDGPFRYDDTAGQLCVELPLTDEAVIAKLSRIRQLDAAEQAAVRELYFQPRASLVPFAFLFADFAEAQRRLIEEPDESARWAYFRHQFALCHERSELIAAHLAAHVAAATGRDSTEQTDRAIAILRSLHGDENRANGQWEDDSGIPPAVTWPTPSGGAFAALLALTGTGLLGEFATGAGVVWRELRGPTTAFGGAADAANVAVATVVPALDFALAQEQQRFVRAANGMLFALPDGAAIGGGQGFTATWSGALLVDEGGAYEFHAGKPGCGDADGNRWRVTLRRGQRHWVLLSRHWPDESAPARHSGPVALRAGAYDLTVEFVQPEPAFEHADDLCPIIGGFQLDYTGPDSAGERVTIPRERLFRPHVDATLADGVAGLDGAARVMLADRYTGSLRDIRRTYQRAFKAVLFAHRFALSALPVSDGGSSEIGYLLGHPAEFSGYSYPPAGGGYTVHRANFDFDLLPVADRYHRPEAAVDLRADPSPRRQQALFDWWERIFDYATVRRETASAPEPPLWLLFHENAETHPDVAGPLRRHLGMDARHVPLVLAYAGDTVSGDDLLDERWATRVWHAERWLRALEREFPVESIVPARPDLWAADDPGTATAAEPVSGNENLTALVRIGYFEHGEPRRYAEITRLNDGLRSRARAALLGYLCSMNRVALPWGGVASEPKHLSDLLLIDVAAADCQRASRIENAISAVQTFVQRARLGLEPGFAVSPAFALLWERCFADFGVWQAGRRRTLYRENWIDWTELAKARRSEAFTVLESELRRRTLTVPVAGGLEYWPAPKPPAHPGQLVLQARDRAQIQGIAPTHHGFGLLGTPELTGRLTWLSTLTLPTDDGEPDPGGPSDGGTDADDGVAGGDRGGRLEAVAPDERLPLWIKAAIDLGTTFLRVAAAGEPPASTSFAPQHDDRSAPCCAECGSAHPAVIDEYYFWLIDFREYAPPRPTVDGGPAEPAQDADRRWYDPAELPALLGWEPGTGVRLAWTRVHNGDFGEPRSTTAGLRVEGPDPQLTLSGRTADSLRFQVSGAVAPVGHRDRTAPGFRYDLATDSAVPLPTVLPMPGSTVLAADVTATQTTLIVDDSAGLPTVVPYSLQVGSGGSMPEAVTVTAIADETALTVTRGANGTAAAAYAAGTAVRYLVPYPGRLPAYPYFVYHSPGASVAPASRFAPAVTVAAALRAHCQPEAALRWYELAFAPLVSDSSWLRCEPDHTEEVSEDGRCCHDSTVASDGALRNRSIILHYLETLFELGDAKRARNTPESWQQARLIYDTALTLLGPAPRTVISTGSDVDARVVATFAPHHAPLNPRLLALYERGADRLATIHTCRPGRHVRPPYWGDDRPDGAAPLACVDDDACLSQSPYRFVFLHQKAMELASEVRSLGAALIAAFEKGDAEYLQALRGDQEQQLLDLATQVRRHQWREADWQLQALRKTKEITQTRYRHQTLLIQNGLSNREDEHVRLINAALGERTAGNISEGIAQLMGAIPDIFAGFPVTQTWLPLGTKLSGVFMAVARIANVLAEISTTTGGLRLTQGGWERREEEWRHQVEVLGLELEQIERQILAADRRRDIALRELNTQQRQVEHAREVHEFLRGKFTGPELYLFLQQETAAMYRQMYELALHAARQAQRAFNHERGHTAATFLPQEAWDHLREGLLAGERLQLGLRQMEHAYLETNHREYELTKHLSLRLDFPMEFLRLQATGECEISVPEWLFDADHAGHYLRRIKQVRLTIPCVVGPYVGVHCRLTLISSTTRVGPQLLDPPHTCCPDGTPGNGYVPGPDDPRFVHQYAATEAIATSTGQNDAGLFELNFRDERRLPFEFAGAVSRWRIELPPENNRFDLDTVSDVVMHLNYTAREGGAALRHAANEVAQRHLPGDGVRYFDVRHDMPDAWHRFHSGPAQGQGQQPRELEVRLGRTMFPFLPGQRALELPTMVVFVEADHRSGTHFQVQFEDRSTRDDRHARDCHPKVFDCVASLDYPGLYWGVLHLDEPIEVTGEHRTIGVLRFPAELCIARTLLLCPYRVGAQQWRDRHPTAPERDAVALRQEW